MGTRLDKELVSRGLAPSRTRAAQLISAGEVTVNGAAVTKPSAAVAPGADVVVAAARQWVSRAAHKLIGALEAFPQAAPAGRRCLDAGASTGGFTQVLLAHGASHVVAADVGHDQLAGVLRQHPQVTNYEGINLRYAQPGDLGGPFELIVADLSFISLKLVLQPLAHLAADSADLLVMVKPQFEIGRDRLPRTGVVGSPSQRREAVEGVLAASRAAGLRALGLVRAPLAGQDGNAEFFLHLKPRSSAASAAGDRVGEADEHVVELDSVNFTDTQ